MNLEPVNIFTGDNYVRYEYAPALYTIGGSLHPSNVFGPQIRTLTASNIGQNEGLIIPTYSDRQARFAMLSLPATIGGKAISTSGDEYLMPASLLAYGNLPGGAYPVQINGMPMQSIFLPNSFDTALSIAITKITLHQIEVLSAFDLSQLNTNPAFTADVASVDWDLLFTIRPIIALMF